MRHETLDHYRQLIRLIVGGLLSVEAEDIPLDLTFFELGLDSLACVRMSRQISERLSMEIDPEALFDHPTVDQLAIFIRSIRHA